VYLYCTHKVQIGAVGQGGVSHKTFSCPGLTETISNWEVQLAGVMVNPGHESVL
jgi:hypothetical protein